ncbi:MAG: hypothetical protein GY711_33500 [bacterium]|nr:hypothetical protein [bacterium]
MFVEGSSTLVALGEAGRAADRAVASGAETVGTFVPGTLVLQDGGVEHGEFEVREHEDSVVRRLEHKRERWPLSSALLLVSPKGEVLRARGERGLLRAAHLLTEAELAVGFTGLAAQALDARDAATCEHFLELASANGGGGPALEKVERGLVAKRKRMRAPSDAAVRELRSRATRVRAAAAQRAWAIREHLGGDASDEATHGLHKLTLELDPGHAAARQRVVDGLPVGVELPEGFDALEWMEFTRATRRNPVRRLRVSPADTDAEPSPAEVALVAATSEWRDDLVGFQSERLLIVTPLARPGAIARCLLLGELVCAALESIFAVESAPEATPPLVLYLYESKDEYLEQNANKHTEMGAGLAWTAGHYDLNAKISRIFLPEGQDAWESVMQTYSHELTHHWLHLRCPGVPALVRGKRDTSLPGYWIVEGFAGFIDEVRFDVPNASWETANPQSSRLDLVANASEKALVPWERLFGLSHRALMDMKAGAATPVDSSWYLGRRRAVNWRHQFYNQGATICRFLFHAEDGARRAALLEFVRAYYSNEEEGLDVEKAFGLSVEELGKLAVAYARGV